MAFDNTCKFLAETFTDDITAWLLGQSVALTRLETKELSLEPIRPDALVLLQSKSLIRPIEFQVDPKESIPFRMADYRLRCFRKYPDKTMKQVVVYLRYIERGLQGHYVRSISSPEAFLAFVPQPLPPAPPLQLDGNYK